MIEDKQLDEWQALADAAKTSQVCAPGLILPTPAYLTYANAATEAVPELIAEVRRLRADRAECLRELAGFWAEANNNTIDLDMLFRRMSFDPNPRK